MKEKILKYFHEVAAFYGDLAEKGILPRPF